MSARTPSAASRSGRSSLLFTGARGAAEHDRESIVGDASETLHARFAPVPRAHVTRLAEEAYDAIVGTGVPIRSFLSNLVVHRARRVLTEGAFLAAAPEPAGSPAPYRDTRPVVVGFDGSPASEAALDRALVIAESLGAPLRLVAAWQYPMTYGQFPLAKWTPDQDIQRVIDASAAARFGSAAPSWFTTATVEGPPARVLLAESRSAQMLVVGSRGHGGFVGLLLGSVSTACAEHAACPVLVMHAPRVEHEDPVSAGAEALGDGSRASDAPTPWLDVAALS